MAKDVKSHSDAAKAPQSDGPQDAAAELKAQNKKIRSDYDDLHKRFEKLERRFADLAGKPAPQSDEVLKIVNRSVNIERAWAKRQAIQSTESEREPVKPIGKTYLVTPIAGPDYQALGKAEVTNCLDEADARCTFYLAVGKHPRDYRDKVTPVAAPAESSAEPAAA